MAFVCMQSLPEICQFNAKRQKAGREKMEKGSCITHRNELQSCSKLFFCFGATALCNRAEVGVCVCLYVYVSAPL